MPSRRCSSATGGAGGAPNAGLNSDRNTSSLELSHDSACLTISPVSWLVTYVVRPVYGLNVKSKPTWRMLPSKRHRKSIWFGPVMLHEIRSALAVSGLNMLATALAYFSRPAQNCAEASCKPHQLQKRKTNLDQDMVGPVCCFEHVGNDHDCCGGD